MNENKDFLGELIDALTELRDEQKKITIPAPPTPADVLKVVGNIAKKHEVTAGDLEVAIALRSVSPGGVTAKEVQLLQGMKEME